MMKAGQYYIGDLCYVLTDDELWLEICEITIDRDDCLEGEFTTSRGIKFAMYNTEYGDGVYKDRQGNFYGVDSGTIGCVAVEHMQDRPDEAVLATFDKDFETGKDGGVIWFGDKIRIDTSDDAPEEEEEEEE